MTGAGEAAVASSADVVVVVEVGVVAVGVVVVGVVAVDEPGDPCVVMLVDVVDVAGELGVVTVWLDTVDDVPLAPLVLGVLVSSAKDALAREVHASMVALTIKSFWDRIERSP